MEEVRVWRVTRAAAIFWGVGVAAVTAVIVVQQFGPWFDTRLPADETARQLKAQLRVNWTFSCTRQEADETIPADIDYYCHPSRPEEIGYFVDTDRTSIEIVSRTG
jgi:hypothetical protein